MATQKAPDGTEYEYNPSDPADVARVAALCEPSYEEKRKRAQAAFEAAAPQAAKDAQSAALGANTSNADLVNMIAELQKTVSRLAASGAAPVAHAPIDPGPAPLGASSEATTPVAGSEKPVEGSEGNA